MSTKKEAQREFEGQCPKPSKHEPHKHYMKRAIDKIHSRHADRTKNKMSNKLQDAAVRAAEKQYANRRNRK